jgi:coenzyme Q-binding protein COQ10
VAITRHAERRAVPYGPKQMFDLVADVSRYPEFLPWCQAARVRKRDGNTEIADLAIGFGPFHETFTSRIVLSPDNEAGPSIETIGTEGPFRLLTSHWTFHPDASGPNANGTLIEFALEFDFRSRLLQHTVRVLFAEAVKRMVSAFEARAAQLYGRL